jgi:hypothetical protein
VQVLDFAKVGEVLMDVVLLFKIKGSGSRVQGLRFKV